MPELSRFFNIVIKMLYSDDSQHHKRTFMFTSRNTKPPSAYTASFLPEVFP